MAYRPRFAAEWAGPAVTSSCGQPSLPVWVVHASVLFRGRVLPVMFCVYIGGVAEKLD